MGAPKGYKVSWNYKTGQWNERKVSPKKWVFVYKQTKKRRGKPAPKGTGFPIGGKIHWKGRFDQYAIKISPNTYKLIMKGQKYLSGWKKRRDKRWR